jgi:ligand-binding SRPBCC domain-containing protein
MPIIRLTTLIHAPVGVCFDLARSVDAHITSATGTGERAVEGVTKGLLTLGDEVTWEATHFAVRQRLRVRITELDPPRRFTDEMVRGAFRSFRHVHEFDPFEGGTRMTDAFEYELPLGPLGWLADAVAVRRHMTAFLVRRNTTLKSLAESTPGVGLDEV